MEVIHLNQRNLAQRWHVSEATLEHWRCDILETGNDSFRFKQRKKSA